MPAEKSSNFGPTLKRLGEILGTERPRLWLILFLTIGSVGLIVVGPRLLGQATDIIVEGVRERLAETGDGIDFGALHAKLLFIAGLYAISWALSYGQSFMLAGVVQRSMYRLRESVETKINKLPLSYIDRQARGDLLSRVTNDIDNLAQSLQQTVSSIITSLLTLIGVTVMMFIISPLLAAIALVTVPLSLVLIKQIGGRAGPRFIEQWKHTGAVNAQAEEVFTGHAIVKSFGRHREADARFREDNDRLFEASYAAQFMSSLIQPAMTFMGNIQYVIIAVVGGLRISAGDQYRRHAGNDSVRPPVLRATDSDGIDGHHVSVGHRLTRTSPRAPRRRRADRRTGSNRRWARCRWTHGVRLGRLLLPAGHFAH
jgi:ATP-binding cassette, subfamily B, multidrug efflux pump